MQTGIIQTARRRITATGRARAALLAATGAAATAATIGLALPAGAAPVSAAGVTGAEHFQIMSTSSTSNTNSLIAYGVVTAAGVDHESANSNGPTSTDVFTFPGGSFKVTHTNPNGGSFNPKTCLFQFSGSGTFKILGGTGKYKGISGSGKFTLSELGIGPKTKSGACSQTANPIAAQLVIDASGKVRLHHH